ncbi:MAG: hypothetical protein A2600_05870 [Candidatus Lambdaproteobacteria bacterium RIFOXYD1_FULL_56_27]|uniref:thioredoxin-dependent peroxiredoxin n=1 Tax=Candidatus Lambdaproteobacteria bacterium RIFOXYD2_FULL_56_26 TaxID=1817773 RepID=A0A1F6GP76_9PROT|nr:MAG: hypothetical protein A2557_01465 [Candidatus Lambdaproteobacteria bacterium RIFOXYD2_FULL_56_26]OGH04079.1 MAG: hypothetical protein A2426_01510 [Candidatus Lambdaproteobacteria bacterium RIFOXYC1_FULL_56_13]OGH09811.1 MAG: hypothetical protein A2600_05870 [Candidatus Lambdaproteobacteria bacterium RIFOXYD1_FULL_56_27]
MKLQAGDLAPQFQALDHEGNQVELAGYRGQWVLLSFYRYASCPFCNLRVHHLSQRAEELKKQNLQLIGIFQSPPEAIKQHAGARNLSFPLVSDPAQSLYRQFSLGTSWWGVFSGMVFKMPTLMQAMANGFWPGSIEGEFTQMPADFLIAPSGKVVLAKYGKDLGDHLSLDEVLSQVVQLSQPPLAEEAV